MAYTKGVSAIFEAFRYMYMCMANAHCSISIQMVYLYLKELTANSVPNTNLHVILDFEALYIEAQYLLTSAPDTQKQVFMPYHSLFSICTYMYMYIKGCVCITIFLGYS